MIEEPHAISCRHVTFRYLEKGKNILENASLSIPKGSITVLMGSSGCGKSTLAAVLCGLLPENGGFLTSGEISLFGRPLTSFSVGERAGEISMMFQNPDLQFCMDTLRKEMYFCLENQCCKPEQMKEKAEEAARLIRVEHLLDRPLHTLSGGEKQRAVLACICLLNARCIVLDEPFANLDPDAVQELTSLLAWLQREKGTTILAIDHIADHWIGIAERFLLLGKGGQMLYQADTQKLFEDGKRIFRGQGVAYPGIWEETTLAPPGERSDESFLHIEHLGLSSEAYPPKAALKPGAEAQSLLSDAQAVIPKGKISAILGPSGSGKTTLLMTLLGQRGYAGSIQLRCGSTMRELREVPRKKLFREVGIAFQNPENQFVTQNVTEEVMDSLKRSQPKLTQEERREQAFALLDRADLRPYQKYSPYMLSQGQQRRLAVLAVISQGQRLLLLDEPTYGQDYDSARALMDLVREKVEAEDLTVLMTTHDWSLARCYADVIWHMEDRKLVREDVTR